MAIACHPDDIDFGMSGTLKHSAGAGGDGENMSGDAEVISFACRVDQSFYGIGTVGGADAGRSAQSIETFGESGFEVIR